MNTTNDRIRNLRRVVSASCQTACLGLLAATTFTLDNTAWAAETNLAKNVSRSGFPSPLSSDQGWGGGSDPWEIVDGLRDYPQWYHGLAFTGGHTDSQDPGSPGYIEPAGIRHATIDFGEPKRFQKVVIWHHGDDHVPANARLEYWNGTIWLNIPYERNFESNYVSTGAGAKPDTYTFAEVTGSKVRYSFDNREQNINGTWNIHGWLYEFEVWGGSTVVPNSANLSVSHAVTPNPVTLGNNATIVLTVSNAGPDMASSVRVVGTLATNLEWLSTLPSPGFQISTSGTFTQDLGTLAASQSTTVTLNIRGRCDGHATNSVSVSADQPDPNSTDNSLLGFVVSIDPPFTNHAFNPSGIGFPSPLESDRGWGGGSYPWHLVDGARSYSAWYNGLAFTGGHTDSHDQSSPGYIEPAGVRQATVNFGVTRTFEKITIWHHGVEYTPAVAKIDYWNGSAWVNIPFARFYGRNYEPGQFSGYGHSDEYYFAPVSGSKVRYSFDNREQNIVGTWNIHGWLYEFEVSGRPVPPVVITKPLPGTNALPCQPQIIAWESTFPSEATWTFELLRDGTVVRTLSLMAVNDGNGRWHADWAAPSDLPAGQNYTLRITEASTGHAATSSAFSLGITLNMQMVLTWPDGPCSGQFLVEEADSAAGPWRVLEAQQVVIDGQRAVIIPMNSRAKFHRLYRP